ncbi:hypothetical protein ABF193_003628, partial [Aeromonas salmonicida]
MNRMTVGELIDELSGYDRSQRVSVYFKGIDLTPYKFVEPADESEVAIYATPFIGNPGKHYSALALSMIATHDHPENHLRPREWAEAMAKSFNDKIGLPMAEVVMVDGYARVSLVQGVANILDELPCEAPAAFSLAEDRRDRFIPPP